MNTVYVAQNVGTPAERLAHRSRAIWLALVELGGGWRAFATLMRCFPAFLTDFVYGCVARLRYRVFGKFDRCVVPPASQSHKFVDMATSPMPDRADGTKDSANRVQGDT